MNQELTEVLFSYNPESSKQGRSRSPPRNKQAVTEVLVDAVQEFSSFVTVLMLLYE